MNASSMYRRTCWLTVVAAVALLINPQTAVGKTRLKNICRVKGQEENTLRGLGLVVGLNGTGEAADGQTMRALARAMEIMGSPLGKEGSQGAGSLEELKKIKNVAIVMVTAVVPETGARRGDKIDCTVSAINGKSLQGGQLISAALKGPNVADPRVYALASGPIHLEDLQLPLVGKVINGCQMAEDVINPFSLNGYITLVLERNHANFQTASDIVTLINGRYARDEPTIAVAHDASNVIVRIPDVYRTDPVGFVSEILGLYIYEPQPVARVVINERSGNIVMGGDVSVGAVIVSHKNIVAQAGNPQEERFRKFDPQNLGTTSTGEPNSLDDMISALNSLGIASTDIIEIIKGIDRSGKLHGRLIVE